MAAKIIYSRQTNKEREELDDSEAEDESEEKHEHVTDKYPEIDRGQFDREIGTLLQLVDNEIRKYSNGDEGGYDSDTDSDYSHTVEEMFASVDETTGPELSDNPEDLLEQGLEDINTKTKAKACTDCSTKKMVTDVTCLKKGQHISFSGAKAKFYIGFLQKQVKLYSHHAIVKQVLSCTGQKVKLVLIHFWTKDDEGLAIRETEETFDLKFDELYIVEYTHPRYLPDEIVLRAERENNKKSKFPKYCPVLKNCEHFATWCVVGKDSCFQVQDAVTNLSNALSTLLGKGSEIANFILRLTRPITGLAFVSADEIATEVSSAAGHITLGVTSGLYLLYCIVMTAYYIKQYRNRTLCWLCLKHKLLNLWLRFGVFGITSMITYMVIHFVLPFLAPPVGIPVLCLLLILSTALIWLVPKITKKFQSPLHFEENQISTLTELHHGDIVNFKYYRLPHYFIVTDVEENPHPPSRGKLKCVHYALPNIFSKRVVTEDIFDIDLRKMSVKKVDFGKLNTYSRKDVVHRARKRVGETNWNAASNRSGHLCHWAKVDLRLERNSDCLSETAVDDSKSTTLSSLFIETKQVHLMEEIQRGDVVQLKGTSLFRDKGILVGLTDLRNGRKFEMQIIMKKDRACLERVTVDLNNDRLFVKRFNPAHCIPMEERAQRALNMAGKRTERWTQSGFIKDCILINP